MFVGDVSLVDGMSKMCFRLMERLGNQVIWASEAITE